MRFQNIFSKLSGVIPILICLTAVSFGCSRREDPPLNMWEFNPCDGNPLQPSVGAALIKEDEIPFGFYAAKETSIYVKGENFHIASTPSQKTYDIKCGAVPEEVWFQAQGTVPSHFGKSVDQTQVLYAVKAEIKRESSIRIQHSRASIQNFAGQSVDFSSQNLSIEAFLTSHGFSDIKIYQLDENQIEVFASKKDWNANIFVKLDYVLNQEVTNAMYEAEAAQQEDLAQQEKNEKFSAASEAFRDELLSSVVEHHERVRLATELLSYVGVVFDVPTDEQRIADPNLPEAKLQFNSTEGVESDLVAKVIQLYLGVAVPYLESGDAGLLNPEADQPQFRLDLRVKLLEKFLESLQETPVPT